MSTAILAILAVVAASVTRVASMPPHELLDIAKVTKERTSPLVKTNGDVKTQQNDKRASESPPEVRALLRPDVGTLQRLSPQTVYVGKPVVRPPNGARKGNLQSSIKKSHFGSSFLLDEIYPIQVKKVLKNGTGNKNRPQYETLRKEKIVKPSNNQLSLLPRRFVVPVNNNYILYPNTNSYTGSKDEVHFGHSKPAPVLVTETSRTSSSEEKNIILKEKPYQDREDEESATLPESAPTLSLEFVPLIALEALFPPVEEHRVGPALIRPSKPPRFNLAQGIMLIDDLDAQPVNTLLYLAESDEGKKSDSDYDSEDYSYYSSEEESEKLVFNFKAV